MPDDFGEFRGMTRQSLETLRESVADLRGELRVVGKVLNELRDFRSRVLAYGAAAAAGASFLVNLLMERMA